MLIKFYITRVDCFTFNAIIIIITLKIVFQSEHYDEMSLI